MSTRGWRIHRVPDKGVLRDEEGRVGVPLWLLRDGQHHSDLELTLSPAEAELLHAQLCHALDTTAPVPLGGPVPDCRKPVHGRRAECPD